MDDAAEELGITFELLAPVNSVVVILQSGHWLPPLRLRVVLTQEFKETPWPASFYGPAFCITIGTQPHLGHFVVKTAPCSIGKLLDGTVANNDHWMVGGGARSGAYGRLCLLNVRGAELPLQLSGRADGLEHRFAVLCRAGPFPNLGQSTIGADYES